MGLSPFRSSFHPVTGNCPPHRQLVVRVYQSSCQKRLSFVHIAAKRVSAKRQQDSRDAVPLAPVFHLRAAPPGVNYSPALK